MRYVVLICLCSSIGCATTDASKSPSSAHLGAPYASGPPAPPEDVSRFQQVPAESRIRDLEHPSGKQ